MSDQPTQPGHPPGWGPPPGQPSGQPSGWGASPSPPTPPPQPQWVAPPPPAPPRNWDQPQPPRPPRPRQRGAWLILAGAAAGLVVAGVFFATTGSDEPTGRAAATTVAINQPTSPPATEPPTPAYDTPTPRDFKLTVKVLEKQNFGSAGSNITYRIEAGWSKTFDPAKTYELTYEVRGGEDGPAINTMTVTGDEYQRENEEYVSTGSVGQKLTVRATDVDEVP
jgi:hypothetical protein